MTDTEKVKRSGRPRAFDPEAGVAAATRLFWEKGYDAVGVAELAQTIGINPPSLYAAYGSKRELFARAVAHYAGTQGRFFARLDADGPAYETLISVLEDAARAGTGDATARGCLVLDGTRNCTDSGARALTAEVRAGLREKAHALIARDRPEVADSAADYFMFVLTAISGSAIDGVPLDRLMQDIALAGQGLGAMLGRG
ncbi:TetR/AcrR family transcriptional regulator [Frigidibacter sp. RF13]|uniref:TetR/AcrR family transcriptional regulator n=1 Tax=Frigidibacter sp. RF13 TaxID=2997340 RepID=UPI002270E18C|nr:TetR/AcrR family transcriptional regulator [Frigidibacter sp. RF13]MCY1127976.1 TetR/AcrR family transcriptional regulator [Frigidibacter sp. RF13]